MVRHDGIRQRFGSTRTSVDDFGVWKIVAKRSDASARVITIKETEGSHVWRNTQRKKLVSKRENYYKHL